MIAETEKIEFQTLAFHHPLPWDIRNIDMTEIRLSGLRAKRCKLRTIKIHDILIFGMLILKRLKQLRCIIRGVRHSLAAPL